MKKTKDGKIDINEILSKPRRSHYSSVYDPERSISEGILRSSQEMEKRNADAKYSEDKISIERIPVRNHSKIPDRKEI